MSSSKHIANSDTCQIGNMTCNKCHKPISGDFLVVDYYVSKRGNESDYTEIFHEECCESYEKELWLRHHMGEK